MTLTQLRYIVALHQTEHFGHAASRCFISQPTLSIAIKKLEQELAVTLFERSRGKIRVTPLGRDIVAQAQHVLEQANVISELAQQGKNPLTSTLSIGAIFTVGPYLFPKFVPQFNELAPATPLFIEENYTAVLRERLRSGELDAIVIAKPFVEADVVCQDLYRESFVVLLNKQHPLAARATISPRQLEREPVLLLGEGHCFRDQVLQACPGLKQTLGVEPAPSMIAGSSLETLKYMVASGLGITVLPASAARYSSLSSDALITRPLSASAAARSIALAWRASFPRPEAIEILSQAIRRCKIGQ